ncbi:MAG: AmmeMemoRadiSam system protein A [bacterium]
MTRAFAGIGPTALLCLLQFCGYSAQAVNDKAAGAVPNEATKLGEAMTNKFSVSEPHQKELLGIARKAIEHYLTTGKELAFDSQDAEMMMPAAVFVTLTQKGQLRGCIGTLEPRSPLFKAVAEYAIAAAVSDGRFGQLSLKELPVTHIEISVLSPLELVKSADDIKQNVHGVVVRRGFNTGLFLPQVWEHFSNKADFLDELCRQKAHLSADAWKDSKTELLVFTVVAFEEPR